MIQNNFNSAGFSWTNLGVVTGSATCTEGYGTDKHDKGVRWNDLDGDGGSAEYATRRVPLTLRRPCRFPLHAVEWSAERLSQQGYQ